jgi:hypothetical protein
MKHKILPHFAVAAILLSLTSYSQKNTAFAVTAATKGTYTWNVIREIDLSTGEVLRTLYDPAVHKTVNYSAAAGTTINTNQPIVSATGAGVAAAAYDAVHNRLYFTNMRSNALCYFDLSATDLKVVLNSNPSFNTGNKNDEANVITRMAFAADGFGYAITNDGKSLIRFTTDQKSAVINLGPLSDGSKNGSMSVHAQPTSWGGDIVGDAYGNLYLFTYRNHVFKINPNTRVADYIGQLKGVPKEFTTNGVVVNDDGDLVVTSANIADNYYRVNPSTLDATAISKKEEKLYNSSDLANANLLYQRKATDNALSSEIKRNNAVNVYPNPVTNKTFSIQFDKVPAGKYNLVLTDVLGRTVLEKALTIALNGQIEKVSLPRASAAGMLLVKLTGGDKKVLYNDKLVVQ